jgi:predicted enzyme related to lactoylglutathione lyase
MPNPIVYFEIVGKDKAALEDFYLAAFDWQLTPAGDRYSHVAPGAGIPGGIGLSADGGPGHAAFYVEVDSIVDTLSRVEGRGGKRLLEPQQMPNGPLIALCADPEGHIIGLIQSGTMRAG